MKLMRAVIHEMTGPVPYELTLGEIIAAGDVTNPYQTYVLSLLSAFFKDGNNYEGMLGGDGLSQISNDGATSTAAIETIKSLSPSDKVNLASYLLACIQAGSTALHSTQQSSSDWIRFVLQRQN